jgi:hypothetical protein
MKMRFRQLAPMTKGTTEMIFMSNPLHTLPRSTRGRVNSNESNLI